MVTLVKKIVPFCLLTVFLCAGFVFTSYAVENKDNKSGLVSKNPEKGKAAVQRIIFEEQKIEGKIRRPQLVLIKADQRPGFPPMIMQSLGKNDNIASLLDPSTIDSPIYQNAFKFQGTTISGYAP